MFVDNKVADATAVKIQPDGKIVMGGYSNNGTDNDFALARYNADGSQIGRASCRERV